MGLFASRAEPSNRDIIQSPPADYEYNFQFEPQPVPDMPFPEIQKPAPAFSCNALMPNKEFKDISLSDYKGKWVVFFWYPLDFTFVCPTGRSFVIPHTRCR